MEIVIYPNDKHEHHQKIAFYEALSTSSHRIELVFKAADLNNIEELPSLENLGVDSYMQKLVHSVIFVHENGSRLELMKQ